MAVMCLLLVSPLVCEVTLVCLQIWDVLRASVQCECPHCMEIRAAIPPEGCFQCLPWANSLGLNWSLFSASKCFLILELQHSPVSSSNSYLNQKISHLFVVPLPWQCFCCVALQCSSMPSLSVITGGHSSKSIRETPVRLQEKCESRSRAQGQPQICWFTVTHRWGTTTWGFVLPLLFFWWKEVEKKRQLLATPFGAVGGILTAQFTAGLELLLKDYPEHSVLLP